MTLSYEGPSRSSSPSAELCTRITHDRSACCPIAVARARTDPGRVTDRRLGRAAAVQRLDVAVRPGFGRPLPRPSWGSGSPHGWAGTASGSSHRGSGETGLGTLLSEIFSRSDLQASVALGPSRRPNTILQVVTDSGEVSDTSRWVGTTSHADWSRTKRGYARHGKSVLPQPSMFRGSCMRAPGTTSRSPSSHRSLGMLFRRGRRNAMPPVEVILEIARQVDRHPGRRLPARPACTGFVVVAERP